MAESVLKELCRLNNIAIIVDSCGTGDYHIGDSPDHRTLDVLRSKGISTTHKGRQLCKRDFDEFDYIFCMDDSNLSNTKKISPPSHKAKVALLGSYGSTLIIEDPYFGGTEGFQTVYQQCLDACTGFLTELGHNVTKTIL